MLRLGLGPAPAVNFVLFLSFYRYSRRNIEKRELKIDCLKSARPLPSTRLTNDVAFIDNSGHFQTYFYYYYQTLSVTKHANLKTYSIQLNSSTIKHVIKDNFSYRVHPSRPQRCIFSCCCCCCCSTSSGCSGCWAYWACWQGQRSDRGLGVFFFPLLPGAFHRLSPGPEDPQRLAAKWPAKCPAAFHLARREK